MKINAKANDLAASGKPYTNDAVARIVLRSQPPHADDVPSMVAYNQRWGGGSSGVFVKDITKFCTVMNVPPNVHIPGRVFKALATLTFAANEVQPGLTVNAVLKKFATTDKVFDGVANAYTNGEMALIGRKDKRAVVTEAETLMQRGQTLAKENGISNTESVRNQGWLQMELVDFVLGKSKYNSTQLIFNEFLRKLHGNVADEPAITKAVDFDDGLIQYDSGGNAVALQKKSLQNQGFEVGKTYINKQSQVFTLIEIGDDGACSLRKLDIMGAEIADSDVKMDGITVVTALKPYEKEWLLSKGKDIKYATNEFLNAEKARVRECVLKLAASVADPPVQVLLRPKHCVVATGDIAKDKKLFVPFPRAILKDSDKIPEKSIKCTVNDNDGTTNFYLTPNTFQNDETCVKFWFVEYGEDANVKLAHFVVNAMAPSLTKLKMANTLSISVPCLVTTRSIKKGERIITDMSEFKPVVKASSASGSASLPVSVGPKLKKPRQS